MHRKTNFLVNLYWDNKYSDSDSDKCILHTWLSIKWHCKLVHGCMVYTLHCTDSGSFTWHKPHQNQTAVPDLHNFGEYSKTRHEGYSQTARTTCTRTQRTCWKVENRAGSKGPESRPVIPNKFYGLIFIISQAAFWIRHECLNILSIPCHLHYLLQMSPSPFT